MKPTKMSLANIQGKLSRAEMKNIMAGSGPYGGINCGDFCNTYCSWPHPCGQINPTTCRCFG